MRIGEAQNPGPDFRQSLEELPGLTDHTLRMEARLLNEFLQWAHGFLAPYLSLPAMETTLQAVHEWSMGIGSTLGAARAGQSQSSSWNVLSGLDAWLV